jgi:dTDP-4-dehydrorhamnose reductase
MRALVFGTTGQVGRELMRAASSRGMAATGLSRADADLADPDACAAAIGAADVEIVVNAAAYTAVDKAEEEPERAHTINADAPGAMAEAAAARGLPLVHISTDYVFDGAAQRPWREDDATGPLGVYGASKLAGEQAVRAAGGEHVILRTAWVFSAHGGNFVKTMLRVGNGREAMRVVADQHGVPTAAADIAGAIWTIAGRWAAGAGVAGTFHYAGTPATTWAEFAQAIFAQSGWDRTPEVVPITTAEWPTPARRPGNSVLDCSAIAKAYGIAQPDWHEGLAAIISDLTEAEQ